MNRAGVAIGGFRGQRGRGLARPRRAPRSRRVLVVALIATGLGLALIVWGGWWLRHSPTFAVSRVESGPYRFSRQADVDAALRTALDRNIWTLPVDEVTAAFAALPWVRAVTLRRRIPETVAVDLQEWRPLVSLPVAAAAAQLVLVGDGRLLRWPDHLQPPGLPVLVGATVAGEGAADQQRLDAATVSEVMAVLEALVATGFEAAYPVDFLRLTPEGVVLELERRAGTLVLGREQFQPRLRRYLLARDRIPFGARVDLRFAERITFEAPPAAAD